MSTFTIEQCNETYLKASVSLFIDIFSNDTYNEVWQEDRAYAYLQKFYTIEPTKCFVALVKGKVVGASFAYSYPWQDDTMVALQELFVDENYRKQGIAKALLQHTTEYYTKEVWCLANENTEAKAFYEKLGFNSHSPYKLFYKDTK